LAPVQIIGRKKHNPPLVMGGSRHRDSDNHAIGCDGHDRDIHLARRDDFAECVDGLESPANDLIPDSNEAVEVGRLIVTEIEFGHEMPPVE
jgi:hypothetical protein